MKQDSLQASDETEQPVRESGIFSDLTVRRHDTTPAPEPGRSVPPPPPRTSSAIVPVAQHTQYEASSTNSPTAPDWEEFDVGEVDADFGPDAEFEPLQGLSPSTPSRSESTLTASARSIPPPPSRRSVPTLPGVSFPDPLSAVRPRSVPPGMWEVSPRLTEAAADGRWTAPDERWTPPAERFTPPSVREMSGTFQRAATRRGSHAAVTQEPAPAAVARGALSGQDSSSSSQAMNTRILSYALLVAAVLIVGCFVGYVLSNRARPGVVQLTTEPADAQVLFDGVAVGSVSPFLETGVTPGTKHHLEVRKDGFRSWDQQVEVQPGQTLVFTVALPREEGWDAPRVAAVPLVVETVAAAAAPPEAPVVADVGQASAAPVAAVPALAAEVDARPRRGSRATPSEPGTHGPGASESVTSPPVTSPPVASPPVASTSGTLRVSSRPWSVVTIDGKVVGNTPQMSLSLAAGSHRVHLRSPDFEIEKELNVSIRAGETETLIVNLP